MEKAKNIFSSTNHLASHRSKFHPLSFTSYPQPNIKIFSGFILQSLYVYHPINLLQNAFLRCPTHRHHCFLSSHWPLLRSISFMAFHIPSIQSFFDLPRVLFCFGIQFSNILCNRLSTILWTLRYHACKLVLFNF